MGTGHFRLCVVWCTHELVPLIIAVQHPGKFGDVTELSTSSAGTPVCVKAAHHRAAPFCLEHLHARNT